MLIVLEGIDGSGKSTLIQNLKRYVSGRLDYEFLYEPTKESEWGQQIRKRLNDSSPLSDSANQKFLDLFLKDRYWDIEHNIQPALKKGKTIFLDRYYFSTAAYQGKDQEDAADILRTYLDDVKIIQPDFLVYLNISPKTALSRISNRNIQEQVQRQIFESQKYLETIHKNYTFILTKFQFAFPVLKVNASQTEEEILQEVISRSGLLLVSK